MDGEHALLGAPDHVNDENSRVGALFATHFGRMALAVSPREVSAGETLAFASCGGAPFGNALLVVVGVDDRDTFLPIGFGRFDVVGHDEGAWMFESPVPPGFTGLHLIFQTFGDAVDGGVGFSNRVGVDFH